MTEGRLHTPLDALLGATPRRVMRHWLSLLLLALAGLGALVFFVRFVTGDDAPYYSAPIERGDLTPLVSERGVVHAAGEVTVRALVPGRLTWVWGEADGRIARGEVLARIDAGELRRLAALESSHLAAAQAALESAEISAREASGRLERFESVWRRSNGRAPSLNEMEAARAEARRAALGVEAAAAEARAARLRLREAEAQAAAADVQAPISGLLAERHVQPGQTVQKGQPLFTIAGGAAPLTIAVPLSAQRIGPIRAGTPARVQIDALPERIQPATLSLLKVPPPPQTAPPIAVFALRDGGPQVRPGMAATVEIELPQRRNVLLVPDAALMFDPAGQSASGRTRPRIYLLSADGEPRRVYVVRGGSDGQRTEIFATGIRPGDEVITGWRAPAGDPRPAPAPSGALPANGATKQ